MLIKNYLRTRTRIDGYFNQRGIMVVKSPKNCFFETAYIMRTLNGDSNVKSSQCGGESYVRYASIVTKAFLLHFHQPEPTIIEHDYPEPTIPTLVAFILRPPQ